MDDKREQRKKSGRKSITPRIHTVIFLNRFTFDSSKLNSNHTLYALSHSPLNSRSLFLSFSFSILSIKLTLHNHHHHRITIDPSTNNTIRIDRLIIKKSKIKKNTLSIQSHNRGPVYKPSILSILQSIVDDDGEINRYS